MSQFEQRPQTGAAQVMTAAKKKMDPGRIYTQLEDTGNAADLRRQERLYARRGYSVEHSDASGLVVSAPRDEIERTRNRAKQDARDRLQRPQSADIPRETGNTSEVQTSTLDSFLSSDDED